MVTIVTTEDICTPRSTNDYIQVEVRPNSAELVKFPIVPLKAGEFHFEVRAYSIHRVNDIVNKTVFVVVSIDK